MRYKSIKPAILAVTIIILLATGISIRITKECNCKNNQQATGSETTTYLVKLNDHL
jgi:hypothetical protein